LVAAGVYGLWYWLNSQREESQHTKTVIKEHIAIEADSLIMQDSLMIVSPLDSLLQLPALEIEDINSNNNIVTE
jgi:hypothetical protein